MHRIKVSVIDRGLQREFTEQQVETICDYMAARIAATKHDNMSSDCMELDDYDGEIHHNEKANQWDRRRKNAESAMKKAKIRITHYKRKTGEITFKNKHGRLLRVHPDEVEVEE